MSCLTERQELVSCPGARLCSSVNALSHGDSASQAYLTGCEMSSALLIYSFPVTTEGQCLHMFKILFLLMKFFAC